MKTAHVYGAGVERNLAYKTGYSYFFHKTFIFDSRFQGNVESSKKMLNVGVDDNAWF